jgi:hypothetical protein
VVSQQQQQQQENMRGLSDQQVELCQVVLSALQQQPAAVPAVLQLGQSCVDPPQQQQQQQQQAAAWLGILTSLLVSSSEKLTGAIRAQAEQQQQQSFDGGLNTEGCDKTCATLQLILLANQGPQTPPAAAAAAGTVALGVSGFGVVGTHMSSSGLLHLTRKVLMSLCTAGWVSRWGCCHLLFACSSCLTAVAAAISCGAAAAAVCGNDDKLEVEQALLQQGVQQVRQVS